MKEQEIYVINSLKGQPTELVANIMAILPGLTQAVEESGWIKIDEDHQPPAHELVRIWNADREEEMIGKYVPRFSICTDDEGFAGDTEYNEADDKTYHPEGWYVFADHWATFTYGLILDNITHYKPLVTPSFMKGKDGEE